MRHGVISVTETQKALMQNTHQAMAVPGYGHQGSTGEDTAQSYEDIIKNFLHGLYANASEIFV